MTNNFSCAVSGEVPQEPYVSRTTGHLYEKRLIEKYVEENRTCPVTGKDASIDDFIPLQGSPNRFSPRYCSLIISLHKQTKSSDHDQ